MPTLPLRRTFVRRLAFCLLAASASACTCLNGACPAPIADGGPVPRPAPTPNARTGRAAPPRPAPAATARGVSEPGPDDLAAR